MILLLIEFVLFVAFVLAIATWVLPALFPSAFKKSKIEKTYEELSHAEEVVTAAETAKARIAALDKRVKKLHK